MGFTKTILPGTNFFIDMIPPTVTAQEHKVAVVKGKPVFYDTPEIKRAKSKLLSHLKMFSPNEPFQGALHLRVKWCFPIKGKHRDGEYKTSKPDTDNLQKMLKDCMTDLGFWKDDAQVALEIVEKFWAKRPGLYIEVWEVCG